MIAALRDWPPPRDRVAAMFNARARTYDESELHRWLAKRTVDLVSLPPNAVVLDAAAGTGLVTRDLIARQQGDGTFLAIDIAQDLLRVARSLAPQPLLAVQADLAALPIKDASIDVAICASALAYVEDSGIAFREINRVLRHGGQFAFQTFVADTLTAPRIFRDAAAAVGLALSDPNAQLGSVERCAAVANAAGFVVDKIEHDTWPQALPDPEPFFEYQVRHVLPHVFERIDHAQLENMRRIFCSDLLKAKVRNDVDQQHIIFVLALSRDR